jgi:hypothetical protein
MDDMAFFNLVQKYVGGGVISLILGAVIWFGSKMLKPGLVQAEANATLYGQLNSTIKELRDEVAELKRQTKLLERRAILLEAIAYKHGIDIEAEYAKLDSKNEQ